MEEEGAREEQLKLLQDGRVYPVGRVLRATFDANNHETLGSDVAGLMINLSRVPYEPLAASGDGRGGAAGGASAGRGEPPERHFERPGLLARLAALLGRR